MIIESIASVGSRRLLRCLCNGGRFEGGYEPGADLLHLHEGAPA